MAKIVEIIGASGAGKSSIYQQLREHWNERYNWVTYDELGRSEKQKLQQYLKRAARVITDELPFGKKSVNKTQANAEWKFINHDNRIFLADDYDTFKQVIMDLVEEHTVKWYDGSDKRFITIYMIMWSIAHIDRIQSAKDDNRYCVLKQGEGFISRIMHLNSPSFDETALHKYLEHLIFPDQLIFLDAPVNEILKRIKNRDRIATLHKDMSDDQIRKYTSKTIKYLKIAMKEAEKRGVDVYTVKSSKILKETTSEIIDIISQKANIDKGDN